MLKNIKILFFILFYQIINLYYLQSQFPPPLPPFVPYQPQNVPFTPEQFQKFPQGFRMPLNGNNYFGDVNQGFGQFPQNRFSSMPQMSNNYGQPGGQQINSNGFNPFLHNPYQMPQINNPNFSPHPYLQFQQRPFHDQPFQSGVENENNGKEQLLLNKNNNNNINSKIQQNKNLIKNNNPEEGQKEKEEFGQGTTNDNSLPEFIKGAKPEFIEEYKRIIRQPNRSYEEQVALIDQIVKKMEVNRQILYKEFMKQHDNKENEHSIKVDKTVSDMSENAKEQFSEISALLNNKSLPDQQRWEQVLQIYETMEPELKNEFEQKFKGFQSAFEN